MINPGLNGFWIENEKAQARDAVSCAGRVTPTFPGNLEPSKVRDGGFDHQRYAARVSTRVAWPLRTR